MNNSDSLKTQIHYKAILQAAKTNGTVGIHFHMSRPTTPTCRLGFTGRKVSKANKKVIAQKLLDAALKDPTLIKAAINMARFNRE